MKKNTQWLLFWSEWPKCEERTLAVKPIQERIIIISSTCFIIINKGMASRRFSQGFLLQAHVCPRHLPARWLDLVRVREKESLLQVSFFKKEIRVNSGLITDVFTPTHVGHARNCWVTDDVEDVGQQSKIDSVSTSRPHVSASEQDEYFQTF